MKSREFFVCVLLYRAIRKAYIIKDKKRRPSNSKAGEKKKRWPGDMKVLRNNAPTIGLLREEKEGSIISRVDGNFPQPYFSVYKKANIRYIKIAKPNTKG